MFEVERRSVVTTVGVMVGVLTELVWMFNGNIPGLDSGRRWAGFRATRNKPTGASQARMSPPQ